MSRILIADEQPLIRHAIRQLLEVQGHSVVAELDDGADALRQALRIEPSLLILDLALPRLGGLEIIQRLRQQGCKVPILVLTAQSNEHFAGLTLQAGGTGFISKQDDLNELVEAVRTLLHGHSYFPSQWVGSVAPHIGLKAEEEQLRSLSARELTVLRYLANGRSNKEIADKLALSDRTVSTYKTRLQQKLNVDSLAQLLEIAWRQGLLGGIATQSETGAPDNAQFHHMFDAMPFPVALRDTEGCLLACNGRFLEFHDISPEQATGMRIIDSDMLPPDQALKLHTRYLQNIALEQPYCSDEILDYQGRRIAIRTWQVPFRDDQGNLIGMLCSTVDLSEQDQQITALTQAQESGKAISRTRTQFLHDTGEHLLTLIRSIQKSVRPLVVQWPDNKNVIKARAQLQTLHEQFEVLLDLVRIERGTLVLMPRAAELGRQTDLEIADFNNRYPGSVLLTPAPSPARCWVDAPRYRQLLRALLEYCIDLGLPDLKVVCQMTASAQAELLWELSVEPGPTSRAEGLADGLDLDEINPRRALCSHLAALMGGALELEQPAAERPLALLSLRFTQSG
ncbi:response regulator [Pseudomonas sp. PDM04]|uniref:response regulator n=1 Tax=Pseudomonas sp. PDM04 TaxID=2769296 RepID=UPI00177FAE41|nr:response regulator [Pseudomonas sp. PDM04]MBD9443310.1 response regulator [Pseudomonas sp. PDM04]